MQQLANLVYRLKENGMIFNNVFDIGACDGRWTRAMKTVIPEAQFHLFEANVHYLSDLVLTGSNFYINVLSNEGRESVQFYPGCNTGDSYYKETTTWYDNMQPVTMPCTTLDKLVVDKKLPIPNLLKIDTQGSELDILSASKSLLGKTELFVCELSVIEYNNGAPKFSDYLDFFQSHEYIPVDLVEVHRAEDILLQLDIAFMLRSAKNQYLGEGKTIRV